MKRKFFLLIGILAGLFLIATVIMQFMTIVDNPPITENISAPENVQKILTESCYDCHSNETKMTWFQKLPFVSIMVAKDVKDARAELNFSQWNQYAPELQKAHLINSVYYIKDKKMPMKQYLWIHPDAEVNAQELNLFENFARNY
ncbi:MAG: heme-binding domain-containing protein [Bacteroidales bacterium]